MGRRVGLMVQFKMMGGMMRTQAAQMETTVRCKSIKPVTGGLVGKARTKTSVTKMDSTKLQTRHSLVMKGNNVR